MARGKLWTREELLLALNLYYKIPFGQFHQHNPKVINLANLMARTPSSVAMQLSNFASLDPYHQDRGVSGLRPPGKLAQQIWTEAQNDWEKVILQSENLLETLMQPQAQVEDHTAKGKVYKSPHKKQDGPTETERSVKVRLGQRFFRREDLRLNPSNGLCLCALHDKAFDVGLLTIDDDYKVMVSPSLRPYTVHDVVITGLMVYSNRPILLPDRFMPEKAFLEIHRNEYFVR